MRVSRHFRFANMERQVSVTDNGSRLRISQLDTAWHESNDLNCPDGRTVLGLGIATGQRVALDANADIDVDLGTAGEVHVSVPTTDQRSFKAFTATTLDHWVAEVI
jgi:hypothetical protein